MAFPLEFNVDDNATLFFYDGRLTLLGPNGSGKTQLLRKMKYSMSQLVGEKKVRYLSAGRIGMFEQYRSDYDGHRSGYPRYDEAAFGSKSDSVRRHLYETIDGDFQTLSVRADILIKVQERLKKLFSRSIFIEWDGGYLKVSFKKNEMDSKAYSSAREASGLVQLVAILAAIYDDEVGALLLDEPEVSLHPQLQAFLMKEIERYSGDIQQNKKLIVLATHSTEFIRVSSLKDLCNIVFCQSYEKPPVQLNPNMGELQNGKLNELLSRIGQEHKLAFFSTRPLLVEGPSDSILCHGIERKLDMFIEASVVQIVPIIGKGEFPIVYKLMVLIGKEPIILTDADSFTDSMDIPMLFCNSQLANELAQAQGAASGLCSIIRDVHSDFCKLADSKIKAFRALLENTAYWKNKCSEDDVVKIYRRTFFSLINSDNVPVAVSSDTSIVSMVRRIDALFSILKAVGCFILKKGTIESYYAYSNQEVSFGKPIAAVNEVESFTSKENAFIIEQYSDVVQCLQYAAKTKAINEVEALRELLLAVLAPVLGSLREDISQSELDSIVKSTVGDRGGLFRIILNESNKSKVSVDVNSKILEVSCFPFEIDKSEKIVQVINSKIGLL